MVPTLRAIQGERPPRLSSRRNDLSRRPALSVLVPARDEERVIERCLTGLAQQSMSNVEFLVLDDHSTDATSEHIAAVASKDDRFRILSGGPLREGWTGKTNACRQLAEESAGEWMLFIDSDVMLAPGALAAVVDYAEAHHLDFVSGFPNYLNGSPSVNRWFAAIIPLCLGMSPLWVNNLRGGKYGGMAMGTFMLFRTSAYTAIGGHESVKGQMLEDVHIGWAARSAGLRCGYLNLTHLAHCDMHADAEEAGNGLTRWFRNLAAISTGGLIALCAFAAVWMLIPWNAMRLFCKGFLRGAPLPHRAEIIAIAALGLATQGVAAHTAGQPVRVITKFPTSTVLWLVALGRGVRDHLTGRSTDWRGRTYRTQDHVDVPVPSHSTFQSRDVPTLEVDAKAVRTVDETETAAVWVAALASNHQ